MEGNGIDQDAFWKAGAEEAEMLVAATDSDNANLMSVLVEQRIFHISRVVAGSSMPVRFPSLIDIALRPIALPLGWLSAFERA